jgi:hypothetical protein
MHDCQVDVEEGRHLLLVFDVDVTAPVDIVKVEVFSVDFATAVGGGIVDDDHLVVGVVLRKDGI